MKISIFKNERVVFYSDPECGLRTIVCLWSSKLGPGVGGVRMVNYINIEEALRDVDRLAKAMAYKSALADLDYGGAKAIIMGDPKTQKTPKLLRSYGRFINSLNGLYYTAPDMGTTSEDMDCIGLETQYVVSRTTQEIGSADATILGLQQAIKGLMAHLNLQSLQGMRVNIQGVGQLGYGLIPFYQNLGAKVIVCDSEPNQCIKAKKDFGVEVVDCEKIYSTPCDIFSPCATGGILNEKTIPILSASIVLGGANNQFSNVKRDSQLLFDRNILWAPDFLINAGGVISDLFVTHHATKEEVLNHINKIYDRLILVLNQSKEEGISPLHVARRLAERRMNAPRS
jgi:glutamate dehydrogenase/leucine dehydrogenase